MRQPQREDLLPLGKVLYGRILRDKFQKIGIRTGDLTTVRFTKLVKNEFGMEAEVGFGWGGVWVALLAKDGRVGCFTLTQTAPGKSKHNKRRVIPRDKLREVEISLSPIDPKSEFRPNPIDRKGLKTQRDGKSGFRVDYLDIDGVPFVSNLEFANPAGRRKPHPDTQITKIARAWFQTPLEMFEEFKSGDYAYHYASLPNIFQAIWLTLRVKDEEIEKTIIDVRKEIENKIVAYIEENHARKGERK